MNTTNSELEILSVIIEGGFSTSLKVEMLKNKGVILSEHYNEENFSNYVGFDSENFGDFWPWNEKGEAREGRPRGYYYNNEVYAVETVLGPFHKIGCSVNELVKYNDWKKQEEKVDKVLHEIWTAGESKNYQGLDLSWPAISRSPLLQIVTIKLG